MTRQPNIIVYLSDQQRWDTLGCYGQQLPVTPNLDALAADGVRFENAFTCQPVCGPARACLQSGMWATRTGCFRNGIALPENTETIARLFNEAGYDTAYAGKWHLASSPVDRLETLPVPVSKRGGYKDYWMAADVLEFTSNGYGGYVYDKDNREVKFKGYRSDCVNGFALDFLKNRSGANPFFLFISQLEPHHQNNHLRFESPKGTKKYFKNYTVPGDLAGTAGDWRLHYPDYLSCCNRLDRNVGELIATLKELGIYDDTLLVYTSDHGSHFRTRNNEYKRSCHDGCIRIPLILRGPGFRGGKTAGGLASLIDLPPTLLKCAGIAVPERFDGNSLASLAADGSLGKRECVYLQISESQTGRAIRTIKWKYSVTSRNTGEAFSPRYREDFLYDLESDPHERNNLVTDPALTEVRQALRALLVKQMSQAGEPPAEILPAE